ncbi:WUSCHEL-related homeobox 8 isoform X2 [Ziziphus jujuba]|uniref:WUSCHEL-related homeobox 8 isoform X2 n=1 Tax=Ziziphus jujuba TaxID=326968 RepID=A0A6P6GFL9_ZIZJJ|nr:WUSCHEL-related homeobox 8 isoform X2 [Ziziphus jujuba]
MASSNRHWPSMFKSKPCNAHHQWQHDINQSLISSGCHRPSYTSVPGGCEERSPEPKPRWNPKPEQIRILEAIFNSGMVNPPRDEIRKIRAQLQEYGQVGDANVFYWFQNRKSRSKHKLRHLQQNSSSSSRQQHSQQTHPSSNNNNSIASITAPSSSSSSSEKSSPKAAAAAAPPPPQANETFSMGFPNIVAAADVSNSPTASVNQTFFQTTHNDFLAEPAFFFPVVHQSNNTGGGGGAAGFGFSELSNVDHVSEHNINGPCTSLLLSEIMNHNHPHHHPHHPGENSNRDREIRKVMKMNQSHFNYDLTTTTPSSISAHTTTTSSIAAVPSPMNHIQVLAGVGEQEEAVGPGSAARSTVFINDVAFEVAAGPFNVREAFGDEAVLIHSSGQPVLTNDWGLTLHSLQHDLGAF